MKPVSVRLQGDDHKVLQRIKKMWPVPRTTIIGAALGMFEQTPIDEQGKAIRKIADRRVSTAK